MWGVGLSNRMRKDDDGVPGNGMEMKMQEVAYILGHSDSELRRLMLQASILRPITERLMRDAGAAPGMCVLDIGSGTGDVAMLAAELVGPRGSVVGIDRSADALTVARGRADEAGHRNITFVEAAAEEFDDPTRFDVAVGRFVLVHQPDPAAFIRAAASHVRPGGSVAFHEHALYGEGQALPHVPLWTEAWGLIIEAVHSVMKHPDAGGRMVAHFHAAGLQQPTMFCEVPIGVGRDSPLYSLIALSVRNLMPQLEKIGSATAAQIDVDTIERRFGDKVAAKQAQVVGPMQFCGWSRC